MAADKLTAYRILAIDIDIMSHIAQRLAAGNASKDEQADLAKDLNRIIGSAKDNSYTDSDRIG